MTTPTDHTQIAAGPCAGPGQPDSAPGPTRAGRRQALALVIMVVLSLVFAWLVGFYRDQADMTGVLSQILPKAQRFESLADTVFAGYAQDADGQRKVGYVSLAEAPGFSGPIEVAVGLNEEGIITQIAILRQTEYMPFLRKIVDLRMPEALVGRSWVNEFRIGRDIDAVTGATASLDGLTAAIGTACHNAAQLAGVAAPGKPEETLAVGAPEVVLILLYAVGFIAYRRADALGRLLQTATLATGVVAIGLWLNGTVSLIHINAFLLGYWPAWQDHLYWYLLVGGVLLPILLSGKSLYCSHICPFGATQQVLGSLGLTRRIPPRWDTGLRWVQRLLVWVAVLCALAFRNPALIPYDLSGALFGWAGLTWQFVVLGVVLMASVVITRPWCNYLCPIRAVTDFIGLARRVVGEK
jgi:NosR/NirI family nitrous oxide reductase transcriptional regulator